MSAKTTPALLFSDADQLTHWSHADEQLHTTRGYVRYRDWCEAEARRLGGSVQTDPDHPERVAVFREQA